jgi:hypothetical protein
VKFAKITLDILCFLPYYHQKIIDFRTKFPLVLHKTPVLIVHNPYFAERLNIFLPKRAQREYTRNAKNKVGTK